MSSSFGGSWRDYDYSGGSPIVDVIPPDSSSSKSSSGGGFWSSVGENLPKVVKGIGAGADIYQSLTGDNQIGFDSEFIKRIYKKKLKKKVKKTLEDMFNVFDISENVYGVTGKDALQEYYERYGDVIEEQFRSRF